MAPAMASLPPVAEHSELVEEMQYIEKLPVTERIKLAQKRRKQQLSNYNKWVKTDVPPRPAKQKPRRGIAFSVLSKMMEAATRGSHEEMRTLLKTGIDPNMKNHDGLTALHQCCIDGTVETVALLLKHGADVNVTDQDMWTPLHAAATCGHFKVVTLLVKAGADVTAVNGDGDMPHDITEEEVTLQYLRNEIMKRNISPEDLEQIRSRPHARLLGDVEAVLAAGGDLDRPVGQGDETFLHVAIAERHNDVVKVLLDNGASVTVQDRDGWQPVHVAAYWCNDDAFNMLAAQLEVVLRAETNDGETPYELCDDPDLKLDILHILKDRRDSSHSGHSSMGDHSHTEDVMDRLPPPTLPWDDDSEDNDDWSNPLLDDEPPSPLVNMEATEMHSDRRSSIKGVKISAPLKRQSSDRSSTKERHAMAYEAIKPSLLHRRGSRDTALPIQHSLSPDNFRHFYETVHPDTEIPEPTTDLKAPQDPTSVATPQSSQPMAQASQPSTSTTEPGDSPDTVTPETTTAKTTTNNGVADDRTKGAETEGPREGVMLRPRKKNAAPPPPRGSLQDLKRQRQEERENRLQRGHSAMEEGRPHSTFYQANNRPYTAPPSDSMIRYKYKMAPDEAVKQTLIRHKKCIVM
ncbi:Protein phosphatase 1 regulatory inhibitor subunit 16B [Chionoecetes opilio]|uniref:Protein phosphatase 1 regulatory inhibitor subunit 16B n=1 Tax=Chionoecetes opilio TaxID=41210 RepID=A0A8J4Y1A9_CHIOP|nr:Protein phosphatase 1 regulatory inhibitor subunit 16B [Chionoecetes opilio]